MNLTDLKSKILIFSNFNTKLGINPAYNNIRPALHYYCNFLYQPVVAANAGTGAAVGSRTIRLSDISGSAINWTDQSRTVWHFTGLDDLTAIPDSGAVDAATNIGIQSITVPYFFTDLSLTQPMYNMWNGYAWRLKPKSARYVKPAPIVPAKPSTALNARVSPDLQPGQIGTPK